MQVRSQTQVGGILLHRKITQGGDIAVRGVLGLLGSQVHCIIATDGRGVGQGGSVCSGTWNHRIVSVFGDIGAVVFAHGIQD